MATLEDKKKKQQYITKANQVEEQYNLPHNVLVGLLATESNFNPNAKSPAGAVGLAQFLPGTAKEYGINPLNPSQAIEAAGKYIAKNLKKFGNIEDALRSYNMGTQGVLDWKAGKKKLPKETAEYVGKIFKNANINHSSNTPIKDSLPDFNNSFTSDVNFLNFSPQMTNFAPVPEKKEESAKNLEVERVEKESKFLRALEQLPQEDFAQLQASQPQVQQYQPQKNYVQEYEQISQFVDVPIAQQGGTPVSPQGLYDYPRQKVVVPTNSGEITMKGINYNVLGIDELGNKKLMLPNGEYKFPGKTITEIPII